jgi:hypothetical protein
VRAAFSASCSSASCKPPSRTFARR